MKVNELMSALSELPSGAEIYCSGSLSINDPRECEAVCAARIEAEVLRSVIERVDGVDAISENSVYLNF